MKKLLILLIVSAVCSPVYSQCTLLANAVAGMTLVHQNTNCFNNSGVAYNPNLALYYAVRAGNPAFPLETWTSTGVPQYQTNGGFDWRGMWWNPLTNQLEGNGYSNSGIWKCDLNGTGWALNTGVTIFAGMNQPDAQSCGDFDCQANEILYYFNGQVYRYSRATNAFLGSYAITGTPVPLTNLNSTTLMFTGCLGKEIALLDYVNKAVYVYDKATGAYTGTSQLPVTAITTTSFRTSWANCKVWLFDVSTFTWFSYDIFNSCTNSCNSCAPVFTPQSFTICAGASMFLGGANQTTSGTYTDSLTNFMGCDSVVTSTLTVNPLPVITVNSPTICPGQTANLIANGGTTYTWSAGATSTGVNTADATPAVTTSYTVTGTTAGCSGTAVATVTVANALAVTVNSPTICAGQTATLTAAGATNYSWSAGATSTGVNTATASPITTTTYTITGTTGTCTGTAVATVTVNSNPVVTVNSLSICSGQTANLTAGGATSYSWSAGATSTGTNTATASPVITTTYTVTGTTGTCTGTAVSTVTVNSNPVVTVNSPTICSGQTAFLAATGATTYTWTVGATSTGGGNAIATPATTNTYTVTGTTSGCTGTAVATVTVNSVPVVTVTSDTICSGQTASLTANGATSYTWSAGATSTGVNTATASPTGTTIYIVTGTTAGCSSTANATVTVNNCHPPVANFSGSPLTICNSGCVTFVDLSIYSPTTWQWLFPGGVPASANTQGPVSVCYSALGQYSVTLIVSNNLGTDTLTMQNYVNIVAPIPFNITGDLMVKPCVPANLLALPSGNTYLWGPNYNLTCSTCQEATVAPSVSTQYYCQYTDINGCPYADTVTVNVLQQYSYLMPTGFSPNGDGINEVLLVKGVGIDFIELKIFDRVGEKVFETSDILKGWDGTLFGQPMNDGEFVYMLEVTYCNGQVVKEQGSVMLEK